MAEFNVSVHPHTEEDFQTVIDVYTVDLPHQCDEFSVASGSKAEAVVQLTRFIAEAAKARVELLNLQPCPHEWEETVWTPSGKRELVTNAGTERMYRCRVCNAHVGRVVDRSTAAPWFAEKYYGVQTG